MPEMAIKLGEAGGHDINARQITGEGASHVRLWRHLHEEIKAQGIKLKPSFYDLANRKRPKTQKEIADAYTQLSRNLGAIPWRHANQVGAYLTACVFYAIFTG